MATAAKKVVTRRVQKPVALATSVTPIKKLTKGDTKTKPSVPIYIIDIDGDEKRSILEEVSNTILTHENFCKPEEGDSIPIGIRDQNLRENLCFLLTGFPHCCGVSIIGEFTLQEGFSIENASKILTDFASHKDMKGHTLQITTAQSCNCLRMAKALAMSSRWQAVKTFKNQNSGNFVTIWVSNNE
jgi:hypothetical protein